MARTRLSRTRNRGAAFLGAGLAAASLTLTSAYASSGTGARGGEGVGGVSGYAVSDVHFELGSGGFVRAVAFRLAPANARTVRVQLSAGGLWLICSSAGAGAVSCPLPAGTGAAGLDQLSVVAA